MEGGMELKHGHPGGSKGTHKDPAKELTTTYFGFCGLGCSHLVAISASVRPNLTSPFMRYSNLCLGRHNAGITHRDAKSQITNRFLSYDSHGRRGSKGYCLDAEKSVLPTTDEEPPVNEEDDITFCGNGRREGSG